MNKYLNKLKRRKLVSINETSISYLQIFGIFLVFFGIISVISATFLESAAGISISFFITMLGFAFVFPSLLEGNDGLSTMRIVVFMMTNVICMLLLKIGWAPTTESLSDIGLDEWWMGVIAFVFGAKAMQSYFESKFGMPNTSKTGESEENEEKVSSNELAESCLEQNKSKIDSLTGVESYFVGLSSNPNNTNQVIKILSSLKSGGTYPSSLNAKSKSGKEYSVDVEVIYSVSKPKMQINSGDSISNTRYAQFPGTICCVLKKGDKNYLLTCGHVLNGGSVLIEESTKEGWFVNPITDDTESSDEAYKAIGTWSFGLIDDEFDVALVEIDSDISSFFKPTGEPVVYENSLLGQEVFVNGRINKIAGYIAGQIKGTTEFEYNGGKHKLKNLILISGSKDGQPNCITEGGDSGSLVYLTPDNSALGMVVGANKQYTYVIPMASIIEKTKTQLIHI